MESSWTVSGPGQETTRVYAQEMTDGEFDAVMFYAVEWTSPPWRVVRALGAQAVRLECWTEDGDGASGWDSCDGTAPAEITSVLEFVRTLPEAQLRDLLCSFQAAITAEYLARHEEALHRLAWARADVDHLRAEIAQSVAKEAALELDPGPLQTAAIALAKKWRGSAEELLAAAEAVLRTR